MENDAASRNSGPANSQVVPHEIEVVISEKSEKMAVVDEAIRKVPGQRP
jgi:hypothetical protein